MAPTTYVIRIPNIYDNDEPIDINIYSREKFEALSKLHWRYRHKLDALLDMKIPESCRYKHGACATFRQVIDRIMDGGKRKVYASGGLVRDIVSGVDITHADVDVKFGHMSKKALKSVFDDMNLAMRIDAQATYTYFFVGCDPDTQLEGHMLMSNKPADIESPGNSLMVDLSDMTLIDPTGVGLQDARAKVWRIPPDVNRDKWFDKPAGPRLLWRMSKFRLRGFSVPDEDVTFIYRKFVDAEKAGKVKSSDYRNLINQVADPANVISMIIQDVEKSLIPSADAARIASRLVSGEEVWKRVEAQGNVPYQKICGELRKQVIEARKRRRT